MKPHELIARNRRVRIGSKITPQMRDRNAAAAAPAAAGSPESQAADPGWPARKPAFPGETRMQELARQHASAPVTRPGPAGGPPAPQRPTIGQQPQRPTIGQQPQQQAAPPPIAMCACPSHIDGDCGHVATLRTLWPAPDGGQWAMLDVCERCAVAIKDDPIARLVTGLQFVALLPLSHDELEEEPEPAWKCPRCGAEGNDPLGVGCVGCLEMVAKPTPPAPATPPAAPSEGTVTP